MSNLIYGLTRSNIYRLKPVAIHIMTGNIVTGTGVLWKQKPQDSNERSGVGPLADPS